MVQVPRASEGLVCPLHQKDMSEVCHKCPWWTQVRGKHPQTEEMLDDWRCAVSWIPIMLMENSQQTRGVGAAMETFRNEVVASVAGAVAVATVQAQDRLQGRLIDGSRNNRN